MNRRRAAIVAGVALAVLLGLWLALGPRADDGLSGRVKPGMTLAEVEGVLGPPVTHYKDRHFWSNPRGMLVVRFDGEGVAEKATFEPTRPSPWERLRRLFGRP